MKPAVVFLTGLLTASFSMGFVASECPVGCLMEYDPVCGSNGVTYASACDLDMAACNDPHHNIEFKYEGECAGGPAGTPAATTTVKPTATIPAPTTVAPSTTDTCSASCTKEFVPVCGSNGKTYANYCGLLRDKCRHPTLEQRHTGVCKPKSKHLR